MEKATGNVSRPPSERVKAAAEKKTVARITALVSASRVKKPSKVKQQKRKEKSPTPTPTPTSSRKASPHDIEKDFASSDTSEGSEEVTDQSCLKLTLAERQEKIDEVHRLMEVQGRRYDDLIDKMMRQFNDSQERLLKAHDKQLRQHRREWKEMVSDQRASLQALLQNMRKENQEKRAQLETVYHT